MLNQSFIRKPLSSLYSENQGEQRLNRTLGFVQLTNLGIGAIIGAGIFVSTGAAAKSVTGPSLMLSFVVAAVTCAFVALCYAELASMVPVAGSAYTYAYTTLGELPAWVVGWILSLGYTVSAAAVAHGISHYFRELLSGFGINLPEALTNSALDYDGNAGRFVLTGRIMDLPAVITILIITGILVVGIKESSRFNTSLVIVKISVILLVICVGAFYVDQSNWTPFAPYGMTGFNFFGQVVSGQQDMSGNPLGMMAGAAMIFFAYIGFDSVCMYTEEADNPQRDVSLSIVASLAVCTVLYVAMAAVLTGMVPYDKIDVSAPVSNSFRQVGLAWVHSLVSLGTLTAITSVVLVTMLTQARMLLAMARDGLLPQSFFGSIHERFRTPWKSSILTGVLAAISAAILPITVLISLVSIGILLVYLIVCVAVLILRRIDPDAERPFRVPFMPVVPVLGIVACLLLMFSLPFVYWVQLFVWLLIGFLIYLGKVFNDSRVRKA